MIFRNNRVYFIKLKRDILFLIRCSPFFKIEYDICNRLLIDGLQLFAYNQILADILGIKVCDLNSKYQGFQITESFLSDDFISLWNKIVKLKLDTKHDNIVLDPSELYIYLPEVGRLKGHFIVYKQIYYQVASKFIIE